MATITLTKSQKKIEVESGKILMQALLEAEVPVASSCNGDGVCAKCKLVIVQGAHGLSAENETEAFLREKFDLKKSERISCQTQVLKDVEVDAAYW